MDNTFKDTEKIYRAVYPPETVSMFWREDGHVSSAAFADPKGLSVDRGNDRTDEDVIADMSKRFNGRFVALYARNCKDVGAALVYLPSKGNPYHSEIHGSENTLLLSKSQRRHLAEKAIVVK